MINFEMLLPRLLHIIAVHPDFSLDHEWLKDVSEYVPLPLATSAAIYPRLSFLDLYVELVLTSDNIHLIYLLSQKVKSVRLDPQALSQVRIDMKYSCFRSANTYYTEFVRYG